MILFQDSGVKYFGLEFWSVNLDCVRILQEPAPTFKTVLCKYFEQGHCSRGDDCTYAHGLEDLQTREAGKHVYTASGMTGFWGNLGSRSSKKSWEEGKLYLCSLWSCFSIKMSQHASDARDDRKAAKRPFGRCQPIESWGGHLQDGALQIFRGVWGFLFSFLML